MLTGVCKFFNSSRNIRNMSWCSEDKTKQQLYLLCSPESINASTFLATFGTRLGVLKTKQSSNSICCAHRRLHHVGTLFPQPLDSGEDGHLACCFHLMSQNVQSDEGPCAADACAGDTEECCVFCSYNTERSLDSFTASSS